MKISVIIDKVSALYRSELDLHKRMREEYREICKELIEAEHGRGEKITLAKYRYLNERGQMLESQLQWHDEYCKGIAAAREILLGLNPDAEVGYEV